LSARFTGAESLLKNVKMLQKTNWPEAEEKRILCGDREVIELTKMVKIDARYISAVVRHSEWSRMATKKLPKTISGRSLTNVWPGLARLNPLI